MILLLLGNHFVFCTYKYFTDAHISVPGIATTWYMQCIQGKHGTAFSTRKNEINWKICWNILPNDRKKEWTNMWKSSCEFQFQSTFIRCYDIIECYSLFAPLFNSLPLPHRMRNASTSPPQILHIQYNTIGCNNTTKFHRMFFSTPPPLQPLSGTRYTSYHHYCNTFPSENMHNTCLALQ